MGLVKQYIAQFWDKNGTFIKNKKFNRRKNSFKDGDNRYLIRLKEGSYYDRNNLAFGILDKRYYQYIEDVPEPLVIDKKDHIKTILSAEELNTMIETKQLKKANEMDKDGLLSKLDFKTILMIGAVILGAYLLITGQLTP